MKPEPIENELAALLRDAVDGRLDDAGRARLNRLVISDPDARDAYLAYFQLHAMLLWQESSPQPSARSLEKLPTSTRYDEEAVSRSRLEAVDFRLEEEADGQSSRHTPCAVTEAEELSVVSSPLSVVEESPSISSQRTTDNGPLTTPSIPHSAFRIPHLFAQHPLAASILVAAFCMASFLLTASQVPVGSLGGLAGKGGAAVEGLPNGGLPVAVESVEYVARFTNGNDYAWDMPDWQAPWRGGGLEKGKEIRLRSGLVEFTFESGAKAVVKGPATFVVIDKNRGALNVGKLMAKISGGDDLGFTIDTPAATIVDLGTEFGVVVDNDGSCEVQMFSGAANVSAVGSGTVGESGKVYRLLAGEAMRISPSRSIETIAFSRSSFGSEFQFARNTPQEVREEQKAIARQYAKLIMDAKPVLYFPMDNIEEDKVLDLTSGKYHGRLLNSPILGEPMATGIVGKALRLYGPEIRDYVMVADYPASTTGRLSVATWVFAHERSDWGVIVSNWGLGGGNTVGQFRLGLFGDSGVLQIEVRQPDRTVVDLREGRDSPLPLQSWQHVAFVADGETLCLYRNGDVVAQAPCKGVLSEPDIKVMGIGVKPRGDDNFTPAHFAGFWHGLIDELAIYDRALSADLVRRLSNIEKAPPTTEDTIHVN